MPARTATAPRTQQKAQRELEDLQLVVRARSGDDLARDSLIRRYSGFVRMKASSYFLVGGESDDLIQEGLAAKGIASLRFDKRGIAESRTAGFQGKPGGACFPA